MKKYQFLAGEFVNWVLQHYLNSHRICHRIFPFQKGGNHTLCILETGWMPVFLVYVAPYCHVHPGATRISHSTSHQELLGCHRIYRPPGGLALAVPVGGNLIAGMVVMVMYYRVRVMVREQTPEKTLLRALLAVGFLRIAMPHSSCRTLPMAGQPVSHIHDRMSL
jgi:hypothetical protein